MIERIGRGVRLTEEGQRYVKTHYPTLGAKRLAEKMGVGFYTIRNYVRNNGIGADDAPAGFLSITDAAVEIGVLSRASLYAKARRQGVLRRRGRKSDGTARVSFVPAWWVREQRGLRSDEIVEELAEADWMTVQQVAEYVGLNHTTVRNALRALRGKTKLRPFIMRYFQHARVVLAVSFEGSHPRMMMHPQDVETARVMLERDTRERDTMLSIDQLVESSGVKRDALWRRALLRGVPYSIFLDENNHTRAYFTPENAERVTQKGTRP